MYKKVFSLIVTFLFLTLNAFSQGNAGLKSLLDKNSEFIFPQTVNSITQALNVKPVILKNADDEEYVEWHTRSGLVLSCAHKPKAIQNIYFEIPDDASLIIDGLPFGLVMNKTTLKECLYKFRKYGIKDQSKYGGRFSGGSRIYFKKGDHYATLFFDGNHLLKLLNLETNLVDPAAN